MSSSTLTPSSTTENSVLSTRAPRGVLAIVMLFTGAAGLVYEYVLSTVNTYLIGNSIEQFSITIGLMFLMMGVGGFAQKRMNRALVESFIVAELLLVLMGGFAPIAMQWLFASFPSSFDWMRLVYISFIGFLIGVEIPLVMRINERFSSSLGSNIAGTWAWDYVGGALGVVMWIVLLRNFVPLTHISFLVAACNLVVAIVALVFFWRRGMLSSRYSAPALIASGVLVIAAVTLGQIKVDSWSNMISQQLYENPIAFQTQTKYQTIVVTQAPDSDAPDGINTELFLNGNKQFSSKDEKIYHELLVHPPMNLAADRQKVLILGGGDGMALREVLKYEDVENVTLVDLDPVMIDLARNNPLFKGLNERAFSDARVYSQASAGVSSTGATRDIFLEKDNEYKLECDQDAAGEIDPSTCSKERGMDKIGTVDVFTVDADQFISTTQGPWDVVIIDLPDPNSIELSKLYSKEFYQKVRRTMSPDGIVVVQSTSPYHAKETYLCIMRTVAAAGFGVLPYHENVPSFGDWGWIIGSPSLGGAELSEKAKGLGEFPVSTNDIGVNVFQRAMVFTKGSLTGASQEISTLMRPTVFDYYVYEAWKTD